MLYVTSQRIQKFLGAFFKYKMPYSMVCKKKHYLCVAGIEKYVPRDHRLSSLGKPRDANR